MALFLGINGSHNGAVCVVRDSEIVFYLEEERLTRIKRNDGAARVATEALRQFGRFDGIYYNATKWYRPGVEQVLEQMSRDPRVNGTPMMYVQHHEAHALSAAYTAPFVGKDMLVVVIDHSGEQFEEPQTRGEVYETESVYLVRNGEFLLLFKRLGTNVPILQFPQVVEQLLRQSAPQAEIVVGPFAGIAQTYGAVCAHLGYDHIEAGKVMGLAPYGKPGIPLMRDGHGDANTVMFHLPGVVGLHHRAVPKPAFQDGAREITAEMDRFYFDLAASVQHETMHAVGELVKRWVEQTGVKNVCLTGGYALNSICNTHLVKSFPDVNFWMMPVAHDGGTAIGCAFAGFHQSRSSGAAPPKPPFTISWGNGYDPEPALSEFSNLNFEKIDDVPRRAAEMVSRGMTIAWHQGRSEAGPRALGNRSILSDPRKPNGRDHVNKLKGREWYRPLAGTMLAEEYENWFVEKEIAADFMMFVVTCRHPERVPAMVHVDGTCRVQTLRREQNPRYYEMIEHFNALTGIPMVLNTSFNPAGEPLCETPADSLNALIKMPQLDALFIEDYLVQRADR